MKLCNIKRYMKDSTNDNVNTVSHLIYYGLPTFVLNEFQSIVEFVRFAQMFYIAVL